MDTLIRTLIESLLKIPAIPTFSQWDVSESPMGDTTMYTVGSKFETE